MFILVTLLSEGRGMWVWKDMIWCLYWWPCCQRVEVCWYERIWFDVYIGDLAVRGYRCVGMKGYDLMFILVTLLSEGIDVWVWKDMIWCLYWWPCCQRVEVCGYERIWFDVYIGDLAVRGYRYVGMRGYDLMFILVNLLSEGKGVWVWEDMIWCLYWWPCCQRVKVCGYERIWFDVYIGDLAVRG